MSVRAAVFAAFCGVLVPAGSAHAQETGNCTLRDNPTRTVNISNRNTPFESWFITEAVFDCPNGRRIAAQTATYSVAAGQITLNGTVEVDDPERSLRSEFAQYFSETEQLHARTSVVLRDLQNGSVITSELLDIFQETPARESLVVATGGQPRAILFEARRAAPDSTVPDPQEVVPDSTVPDPQEVVPDNTLLEFREMTRDSTVLDAQEIRITGGSSFRGTGNAVMRRDSLTATGHAIEFMDQTRRLDVMGAAHVQLPGQELRGDTIVAMIDDQDRIDNVLARHGAMLEAEDLTVTAPAIRLLFVDGGVERLIAMGWEPAPGAAPHARPHVESDAFILDADSIDVLAPGQQVTAAVAIGNARGERVLPDSLRALLPDAPPEVLALLSSDWMRGDTVRARFAPNPRAETDSTADATIMEQLSAHGDQAQSMYSVRDDNDPAARLSFNYLLSSYIEVNFVDGEVGTVTAAGDARGVYLQPEEAARAASGNTVGLAPSRRRP